MPILIKIKIEFKPLYFIKMILTTQIFIYLKVLAHLLSGKAQDSEPISGQAFFVTDSNPVNNLKYFLEPILPHLQQSELPKIRIPVRLINSHKTFRFGHSKLLIY